MIIQKIAWKNSICRIYEIVTYYSRLVRTSLCKTRIDFDHKKSQITGVYEVNYRVGNDEAILREYYFNKVSILNWMDKIEAPHLNIMITIMCLMWTVIQYSTAPQDRDTTPCSTSVLSLEALILFISMISLETGSGEQAFSRHWVGCVDIINGQYITGIYLN